MDCVREIEEECDEEEERKARECLREVARISVEKFGLDIDLDDDDSIDFFIDILIRCLEKDGLVSAD